MSNLAQQLFDGSSAESQLEELLEDAGVPFERIGWDWYDCSLEIYGVPADYRLTPEARKVFADAGFAKCYVNHVDKWETHYGLGNSEGWRVSYPHKRNDGNTSILVEQHIESWPQEWFDTGYVKIVPPSTRSKT